jgi:hypothetical protein
MKNEVLVSDKVVSDNSFLLSSMDLRGLVNEEFRTTDFGSSE